MKSNSRNIVAGFLLVGYSVVGCAGQMAGIRYCVESGVRIDDVKNAHKSHALDLRPYWTQKKHLIPSNKLNLLSETEILQTFCSDNKTFQLVYFNNKDRADSQISGFSERPRSPPFC